MRPHRHGAPAVCGVRGRRGARTPLPERRSAAGLRHDPLPYRRHNQTEKSEPESGTHKEGSRKCPVCHDQTATGVTHVTGGPTGVDSHGRVVGKTLACGRRCDSGLIFRRGSQESPGGLTIDASCAFFWQKPFVRADCPEPRRAWLALGAAEAGRFVCGPGAAGFEALLALEGGGEVTAPRALQH